jgi:hypothetical protein
MGVTLRLTHYAMPRRVMPGLVVGIHVFDTTSKTWMAGTSPAMTLYICLGWVRFDKKLRPGLRHLGFVLAKWPAQLGFVLADLRWLPGQQTQSGGSESAHGEFAP